MRTTRGVRVEGILAMVLLLGMGSAVDGKPPKPPPDGKSIFYATGLTVTDLGSAWKMASDGSGKTSLSGHMGRFLSDVPYGDTYWTVGVLQCDSDEAATPEGYARYKIVVAPVDTGGEPFVILNDELVNPFWGATFRPGSTPRVTYVAVTWAWDATSKMYVPSAGLYELAFDADRNVGTPKLLMEGRTFNGWLNTNYKETVAQLNYHDWLDGDTIVYGDGAYDDWGNGKSLWAQLYVGDFDANDETDKADHTALIAEDEAYMGFGVMFNSTGSKVIYSNTDGIYEISTAGNSTPTQWVANKSTGNSSTAGGGSASYLDDDTIIYVWEVQGTRNRTQDVYKMKRGSAGTNLTGDTSLWCDLGGAR